MARKSEDVQPNVPEQDVSGEFQKQEYPFGEGSGDVGESGDFEPVKVPAGMSEEEWKKQQENAATIAQADDEDVPEQFKGKSKKQIIEEMQQQQSIGQLGQEFRQGMNELAQSLRRPAPNPEQGQGQKQQETEEEFRERARKQLWKGDPMKVLDEFAQRKYGPELEFMRQSLATVTKQQMKTDPQRGELFKKYEDEIDRFIQDEVPVQQRNHPQVYEYAYKQVMDRHRDEIQQTEVQKQVAEQLRKLGFEVDENGNPVQGSQNSRRGSDESVRRSAASGARRVPYTEQDEAIARKKNIPLKTWLEIKQRRGNR